MDKPITDCITMHFLELPKLKFSDVKKAKRLEAWGAYFSGISDEKELEVLCMNEPLLKEALSYEQVFANNDEMYRKYQQREDAIREETTKINLGIKRGIKQGLKQGIKQGMLIGQEKGIAIGKEQGIAIGEELGERRKAEAMAREMLADKEDINRITKYTKLSIDEIKALAE